MPMHGHVFSDFHNRMKRCPRCERELTLLKAGDYKTDDLYRCTLCQKNFERGNTWQVAVGGLKLWFHTVKFLPGFLK